VGDVFASTKAVCGACRVVVRDRPHTYRRAKNPSFRSAAMIRSPISPTENPFRARPTSNICGTSCAGVWPTAPIAISSSHIPTNTRRNTMAIARWARRPTRQRTRTRSIQRLGPSSTAGSICRTTNIGCKYGGKRPRNTSGGPTPTGRPLRICRSRASSGHPAPLLRRRPRSRCATAGIGSSWPGRSRATGRQRRRQGRPGGADRAGRQERRRLPRCRRRGGQGHCLYGQLRHRACRIRQIRRFAPALFRPTFAEERDSPCTAIGQARSPSPTFSAGGV
jgi:hypothetical protein